MRIISRTPEITLDDVHILTGCADYAMHDDLEMTDSGLGSRGD